MHPYERISAHYRQRIRDGELEPGTRLPSIRDMADEHGVTTATARHAIGWLRTEGYVITTARGTFVSTSPLAGTAPRDRRVRTYRTGSLLAPGESMTVTLAGDIVPPTYVNELFDVDPGTRVSRREYVIRARGGDVVEFGVDWVSTTISGAVPGLMDVPAPGASARGDDLLSRIEADLGRRASSGRDSMHARVADAREARHLECAVGTAILAGATEVSDEQGLLVYTEWCKPFRYVIGYEYEIDD